LFREKSQIAAVETTAAVSVQFLVVEVVIVVTVVMVTIKNEK